MKKLLIFACLIFVTLSLHAAAIQEDIKQDDEKTRVSYAFGMLMGSNLTTLDLDIDYTAFAEGVRDMMANSNLRLTEQEAMEIVQTAVQVASERKAEENRIAEELYLAQNKERENVLVTESGLQYEILTQTEGEKPIETSTVRVHYEGVFLDGNTFDKSTDEEGAFIPLEMVVPGWTEGLLLMSVGSKYRFFIPSHLAYGQEGIQSVIPPYSPLIFTVELLEIINDEAINEMLEPLRQSEETDDENDTEEVNEEDQVEESAETENSDAANEVPTE